MSDTLGKLASFFLSAVVFFIVPIMLIALKQDDTHQTMIDDAVVEFVDNSRAAGQIDYNGYMDMCRTINQAQPNCNIEISYKSVYAYPKFDPITNDPTGEYIRMLKEYNKNDILNEMTRDYNNPSVPVANRRTYPFELNEGGYLSVHVNNTTPTLGTKMFRLFVPMYAGRTISASYGGYVGNTKQ